MATENNIPRDVQDSIREVLDKRIKFAIKRMVQQETRSDRVENKVLAFTLCRCFVLTARVPSKVDFTFHFLEIQAIESKKPNQLVFTIDGKGYTFITLEPETEEVNYMITHIGVSLRRIFPTTPLDKLVKKIEVKPPGRLSVMYEMMKDREKECGPCGGFSTMYACMCDYHHLPCREDVVWDVDTIYLSQDTQELRLKDFDHLFGRDLLPIISSLENNSWFKKLDLNNLKLTTDVATELVKVIKKNPVIEELSLSNTGIKSEFIQKLSVALLSNSNTQLSKLDLSNNSLDDRGVIHFVGSLCNTTKNLTYLDLSKTGLSSKGVGKIAEALTSNQAVLRTLLTLKVADNSVKDDVTYLCNLLAQPNSLCHLDLSGTECPLDVLSGALLRGCTQKMKELVLARNVFTVKKMKEASVPMAWKQFFSSANSLKHLDLSGCKLPLEALKDMLLGISSNLHIHDLHLDLSSNDIRSQAVHNMLFCISCMTNVTSLDISNNGFDNELPRLLNHISKNKSLKRLAIGRNFNGMKAKHLPQIMDAIVQLIQEDESSIQFLSLADSKLKGETTVVINALGSNVTLTGIDISGNLMDDFGARMLAKALQINSKLRTIMWDKNATTAQGFEDIAVALEKNYTLKEMPAPICDAVNALKTQPEKTEAALHRIEYLLQRNHSPRKFSSEQAYRLQQSFLISSTQQMVDRLMVNVQDTMNALTDGTNEGIKTDIEKASNIIKDADNSRQLLPRLQAIAVKSQDDGNMVDQKLKAMSQDLRNVLDKHTEETVAKMMQCAMSQCSTVLSKKEFQQDLEAGNKEKKKLPKNFVSQILQNVSMDIFNKLGEMNLIIAAHISDRVTDEVIETLSHSSKQLTNYLNLKRSNQPIEKVEVETKENVCEKAAVEENEKEIKTKNLTCYVPSDAFAFRESPYSPKLSNKKKSLYGRKLRPQSVIDQQQVQKALEMHAKYSSLTSANVSEQDSENGRADAVCVEVDALSSASLSVRAVNETFPGVDPNPKPVDLDTSSDITKKTFSADSTDTAPTSQGPLDSVNSLSFLPSDLGQVQKLEHLNKGRPRRQKNHQARIKTAAFAKENSADDLDTFYSTAFVIKDNKPQADKNSKEKLAVPDQNMEKPAIVSPKGDMKQDKKKSWNPFSSKDKEKKSYFGTGLSHMFSRKPKIDKPEPSKSKTAENGEKKVERKASLNLEESPDKNMLEDAAEKVSQPGKEETDGAQQQKEVLKPKKTAILSPTGLSKRNFMAEMKVKQEKWSEKNILLEENMQEEEEKSSKRGSVESVDPVLLAKKRSQQHTVSSKNELPVSATKDESVDPFSPIKESPWEEEPPKKMSQNVLATVDPSAQESADKKLKPAKQISQGNFPPISATVPNISQEEPAPAVTPIKEISHKTSTADSLAAEGGSPIVPSVERMNEEFSASVARENSMEKKFSPVLARSSDEQLTEPTETSKKLSAFILARSSDEPLTEPTETSKRLSAFIISDKNLEEKSSTVNENTDAVSLASTEVTSSRPVPSPRNKKTETSSINLANGTPKVSISSPELAPAKVALKPPSLTPKPLPPVAPKPAVSTRPSLKGRRTSESNKTEVSEVTATSDVTSGVVYDSATLKLSVKEKISKLTKIPQSKKEEKTGVDAESENKMSSLPQESLLQNFTGPESETKFRPHSMFASSKIPTLVTTEKLMAKAKSEEVLEVVKELSSATGNQPAFTASPGGLGDFSDVGINAEEEIIYL